MRFAVIRKSFQFTFIDFYYWSLFWDSLFYCLAFCGNLLFEFYRSSTDWLSHDGGSGCGESWNRLLTVLDLFFFFCLLVLCFCVAPSRVFFENVLSPQWLCGNSWTWAHDVRLHIAGTNEPKSAQQAKQGA